MSWLTLPRKPEPEVMDSAEEAEVYASSAAERYLDAIDNTLVEMVARLGFVSGRLLDLGCGPGNIALKLAKRFPEILVVGVDYAASMVRMAASSAATQGLSARTTFLSGDAKKIPFADQTFDMVLSNSVLHHLANPVAMLDEMRRVMKPHGLALLRDLRRPGRLMFSWHVRWYGRHYSGLMKKLYTDSVRASYTGRELARMLHDSRLAAAQVYYHERTHLGFVYDGRARGAP